MPLRGAESFTGASNTEVSSHTVLANAKSTQNVWVYVQRLNYPRVHEDDNVLVMRKSDIDDNGIAYFTSNVSIKHEGLYWRTMVKKDE